MFDSKIRCLIVDVDNTLIETVGAYEKAAERFFASLAVTSGVNRDTLEADMLHVFETRGGNDYAEAIGLLPSILAAEPGLDYAAIQAKYAPIVRDFHRNLEDGLEIYAGIVTILSRLQQEGVRVVAYSETDHVRLRPRLRRLGLESLLDAVYAPLAGFEDGWRGDAPVLVSVRQDGDPIPYHGFANCAGKPKSYRESLLQILVRENIALEHAAMLGDHIVRDCGRAREIGMASILAGYGRTILQDVKVTARTHPYIRAAIANEKSEMSRVYDYADVIARNPLEILEILDIFQIQSPPHMPFKKPENPSTYDGPGLIG